MSSIYQDFMYAQIDDSKYVFGEKGQRVGMNKEIVEKIIPNSKKATSNEEKGIHSLLW